MTFRRFFLSLPILALPIASFAGANDEEIEFRPKKFYFSNCYDGALFTIGSDQGIFPLNGGLPTTVGTPRFSYFFNFGTNLNFDINNTIGVFTGIGLKNLGFIEKITSLDSTIKRRTYNLGIPVGVRVGNIKKKTYVFAGAGIDMPINYKEKGYVTRGNKDKFNEWFSNRVPATMPYGFAGISFKGFYLKAQYYPQNFLNPAYTEVVTVNGVATTVAPYAKHDIRLFMLSIGFDIRYTNKLKVVKKEAGETIM